jgi:hypothetical protein
MAVELRLSRPCGEVPAGQIEYGDYVWVRDKASASLIRHFPEHRFRVAN